ncbi:hypothetical protein HL670_03063 [Serratia plymuthica]|nr:hypothetical protein HL670_03063 [Serratia plymuthica]
MDQFRCNKQKSLGLPQFGIHLEAILLIGNGHLLGIVHRVMERVMLNHRKAGLVGFR